MKTQAEHHSSSMKMSNSGESEKYNSPVQQFSATTSMHGFSHLNQSSTKLRVFWLLVIAWATIGTAIHLYTLINLYLRYVTYFYILCKSTTDIDK